MSNAPQPARHVTQSSLAPALKKQQERMKAQQPEAPEPMPKLSPSVMALLSGSAAPPGASTEDVTTVPGLKGHLVPSALAGLHSVALHVLAAAGVLLPVRGDGEPDAKRMRTDIGA